MATLKTSIEYAKQNPDTPFANELKKRIVSGSFDEQAKQEGLDLTGLSSTFDNRNIVQKIGDIVSAPGEAQNNIVKGALKGVASTATGLANIGDIVGSQTAGRVSNYLQGKGFTPSERNPIFNPETPEGKSLETYTKPEGTFQNIGYGAEKIAEFLAPSGAVMGANKAINTAVEVVPFVSNAAKAITTATEAGAAIPKIAQLIQTGSNLTKIGLRAIPEAISAGLVSTAQGATPEEVKRNIEWAAGISTGIGVAGLAAKTTGSLFKDAARRIYQSALRPSLAQGAPAAKDVVETGLKEGIRLTNSGVEKTASVIEKLESKLGDVITKSADKGGMIKTASLKPFIDDAKSILGDTVDVEGSSKAIQTIDDMYANFVSKYGDNISVDVAQNLKKNTYQVLKNSYGELANATREGMKQLTRGLKEGIVDVAPQAGEINARLKNLYQFDEALSHANSRYKNLNLLGLGTKILATSDNKIVQLAGLINQLVGSPLSKSGGSVYLYKLGNLIEKLSPEEISTFSSSQTGRKILERITGKSFTSLSKDERTVAEEIAKSFDKIK